MRALLVLLALSSSGLGQGFVRPWVVKPAARPAGLHSPFLVGTAPKVEVDVQRVRLMDLLNLQAEFPDVQVIVPCWRFPGNPVFVIQGDKVTIRKLGLPGR